MTIATPVRTENESKRRKLTPAAAASPAAAGPEANVYPVDDDMGEVGHGPRRISRDQFAEALMLGETVTSDDACLYPDLVQVADPALLPNPWMLRAIRMETSPGRPHYVLVGPDQGFPAHKVFHVQMLGSQRAIVSLVDAYRPLGAAEKFHHDLVTVTPDERASAIKIWDRVDRFVREPMANASLLMIAKPQASNLEEIAADEAAEAAPVEEERPRRRRAKA